MEDIATFLTPLALGLIAGGMFLLGVLATRLYDMYYRYATKGDLKRYDQQIEGEWRAVRERVEGLKKRASEIDESIKELQNGRGKFEKSLTDLAKALPELQERLVSLGGAAEGLHELVKDFALRTRVILDLEPLLTDLLEKGPAASEQAAHGSPGVGGGRIFAQLAALRAWHREHDDGEGDWNELLEALGKLAQHVAGVLRAPGETKDAGVGPAGR